MTAKRHNIGGGLLVETSDAGLRVYTAGNADGVLLDFDAWCMLRRIGHDHYLPGGKASSLDEATQTAVSPFVNPDTGQLDAIALAVDFERLQQVTRDQRAEIVVHKAVARLANDVVEKARRREEEDEDARLARAGLDIDSANDLIEDAESLRTALTAMIVRAHKVRHGAP